MTHDMTPSQVPAGQWSLVIPGMAQALIALDYSVMYVALPMLSTQLRLNVATAQWIISLYGLAFAGFLLLGGWLCDRFGALHTFRGGALLFLLMSAVGGIAQGEGVLLLARAGQGTAAAIMQPAILALIAQQYQGDAHRKALSLWSAIGALGLVAGVILGGILASVNWRWIFFINIPPALLTWYGAGRLFVAIHADKKPTTFSFGALLGSAATASVVWALMRLSETKHADYLANRVSALLVLGFVLHEWITSQPLLSPSLRSLHSLRTGWLASACYMASVGSQFYVMTLLWQQHYQFDVFTTGLLFMPLAAAIVIGNKVYAQMTARASNETLLLSGFLVSFIGLLCVAHAVYVPLSVGFSVGLLLSGLGHGVVYPALFALGLQHVPLPQQGRASAVMVTSQYASGAVMVALLTLMLDAAPSAINWSQPFWLLAGAAGFGVIIAANARPESLSGQASRNNKRNTENGK